MLLAILVFALILAILGAGAVTNLLWILVALILVAIIISYGSGGRVP